ncbi:serine protein kinase [Glarea lozoyensis ATCC 20868]|uniref:Serine protein kinase n=1 Tax=Glarea lozoyensis (strain ATCC 20868 / MF5171) TaxID=1116229 RepID=S3D0R3_GLAL2|nr:serine protein kinase [Glarea lozoyensis ATCC 20868]EPE31440.1 serine protein kinase [Glarea lozoyensis ATCC 20868]
MLPFNERETSLVKDNIWLRLSVGTIRLDDVHNSSQSGFLIFADTVVLSGTHSYPGKHVGVFCRTLILETTHAIIDVSGTSGSPAAGRQDGSDAGTIAIYVQELQTKQIGNHPVNSEAQGLFLKANGGNGSQVVGSTDAGKGGRGGDTNFFFGHSAVSLQEGITSRISQKRYGWVALAAYTQLALSQQIDYLKEATPTAEQYYTLMTAYLLDNATLGSKLEPTRVALVAALDYYKKQEETTDPKLLISIQGLVAAIKALSAQPDISVADVDTIKTADPFTFLDASFGTLDKVKVFNPASDTVAKLDSYAKVMKTNPLAANSGDALEASSSIARTTMIEVSGGMSSDANKQKPGTPGVSSAMAVTQATVETPLPLWLLHPDQCQMMLTVADNQFFSNNAEDIVKAANVYRALQTQQSYFKLDQFSPPSANLKVQRSWNWFENAWSALSFNGDTQLRAVTSNASISLSRLQAGQDFFGNAQKWAPRLSYKFYAGLADDLKADVSKMEEYVVAYEEAYKSNSEAESVLANAIETSSRLQNSANTKIAYLLDRNGPIRSAESKIASMGPLVRAAKSQIGGKLVTVANDIRNHINMDPQIFIDAMSMIAMAPHKSMMVAEAVSTGYKALTTVKGADGVSVNKSYVINELRDTDGSLERLKEGFQTRSDGYLEIDDPGASKLLIIQSDLDKLMKTFKSAIPDSASKDLDAALSSYISLVLERNGAVINYNTSLLYLAQAVEDRDASVQSLQAYGSQLNKIDKSLQSPFYLLRQMLRRHQLLVLDSLTCCSQSLRLWGLQEESRVWSQDSGLPTVVELYQWRTELEQSFKTLLGTRFGGLATNFHYGSDAIWHMLEPGEVEALKEASSVDVAISPGAEKTKSVKRYATTLGSLKSALAWSITEPSSSAFYSCSDFRVTSVSCFIEGIIIGAKPHSAVLNKPVKIRLQHFGDDAFVREDDFRIDFSNSGVLYTPSYDTSKIHTADEFAAHLERKSAKVWEADILKPVGYDGLLVPLGPFATWEISLHELHNTNLDLSKVTHVWIVFEGTSVPFRM